MLSVELMGKGRPFHEQSPAGKFMDKYGMSFKETQFEDPHRGSGGFGRSTAEFLSVYLAHHWQEKGSIENISVADMIQEYQSFSEASYPPSGADLVAQFKGGACVYDGNNYEAQSFHWPWPNKSFLIFKTGKKLATHDHLDELENLEVSSLRLIAPKNDSLFFTKKLSGFYPLYRCLL